MQQKLDSLFNRLAPYGVRRDVSMATHTSFRIGGPAQLFFEPHNAQELFSALDAATKQGVAITLMGNGTNLLVSDEGIAGLVIRIGPAFSGVSMQADGSVRALAGTFLSSLANYAAEHGLMGLEWAGGIPGTVGGALAMNAGAYGGEVKDVLKSVEYIDMADVGQSHIHCRAPLDEELHYRHSAFAWPQRITLSGTFSLLPEDGNLRARMQEYAQKRKAKQPLSLPNAGSAFKRPKGHFAGALIEAAGLKGHSIGGAKVSDLHAGFIVNTGGASCKDVLLLIEFIKARVLAHSGVLLEPEIKLIGRATML